MNSSIIVILLSTLVIIPNVNSQVGVNIKNLMLALSSKLNNLAEDIAANICDSGFKLTVSGDNWECLKSENIKISDPENEDSGIINIANECPSTGCPINPGCSEGFELLIHGDNCCCVKKDFAQPIENVAQPIVEDVAQPIVEDATQPLIPATEEVAPEIAPDCPSVGCPKNPICKENYQLLIHESNCCCVKEDVVLEPKVDVQEPKICPLCSSESGHVDCSCISPYQIIDSIANASTKCCFLPSD